MPFVHDHVDGVGTHVGHPREAVGDVRLHRRSDPAGVGSPLELEMQLDADAALLARDLATLERVVAGSCRLKAQVVERDEREAELRWVLNYGHTIGHALEAATGFRRWAHGEAVSLGIAAESRLAERLGIATAQTAERQLQLLRAVGLPVRGHEVEPSTVMEALTRDKKSRDGQVSFVFAPEIGSFRIVPDVPRAVLVVLADLR